MKRNRLLMLALIILSGTFASFYGGVISYFLLFFTFVLPIVSLIYMFFVYERMRVHQTVESRTVYKGENIGYRFSIGNEDKIPFTGVHLTFLSQLSTVRDLEENQNYCLLPGDWVEKQTTVCCHYRGEYRVGVDSIVVTDFLNLFHKKYQVQSPVVIRVLPRVVKIEKLVSTPLDQDIKSTRFYITRAQDQPDVESRLYQSSDSLKMVNWKLSAKYNELLVRKYINVPKSNVFLFLDLSFIDSDSFTRTVIEDKIIECVLAVSDYLIRHHIAHEVIYNDESISSMLLRTEVDFDAFYRICSEASFFSRIPISVMLEQTLFSINDRSFCMIITSHLTDDLCLTTMKILELSDEADINIICIDDVDFDRQAGKFDRRIKIARIAKDQEITDVLDMYQGEQT